MKETPLACKHNISIAADPNFLTKSDTKKMFLPDLRFFFYLCSAKPGGGFSVNAFSYMKREFHQKCWEFLWCPKGNMRNLEADERDEKWGSHKPYANS